MSDQKDINDVKQFWNARPCNYYHSQKPVGTFEYFEEVEKKKYRAEPHILTFAEFDSWKNSDVLEIGCGMGTAVISFAKAGANVTAIDLSDVSAELCKKRLEVYGLKADIHVGNAEQLDQILTPNKKYDLIYSFGVIHHTPNPHAVIQQLSKFIKPGGQLRIMLYSLVSYKVFQVMHESNQWNISQMRQLIEKYSEAQTGSPCTYVYTYDEVGQLLEPYFKIKKIWKDHIFTWDIDEYKRGNFVRADSWKDITDQQLKALESELGWHTLVIAEPK